MTPPAVVRAEFVGGPFDGEVHELSHASERWSFVIPPEVRDDVSTIAQLAGRQVDELPCEVYVRDEVVGSFGDLAVWRYRYSHREVQGVRQ